LTCFAPGTDTDSMMQMSVNRNFDGAKIPAPMPQTLAELREGDSGIIDLLDLPEDVARRLMELGFLPGHVVVPARSAPGGEPRVYRVDGSEVALRRETAAHLILRGSSEPTGKTLKP
jgi:ferrous iron transport protein A